MLQHKEKNFSFLLFFFFLSKQKYLLSNWHAVNFFFFQNMFFALKFIKASNNIKQLAFATIKKFTSKPSIFFSKIIGGDLIFYLGRPMSLESWDSSRMFCKSVKINFLKFYFLFFRTFPKVKSSFHITQRLFLSTKTMKHTINNFLYSSTRINILKIQNGFFRKRLIGKKKIRKARTFFFNTHKKLAWKMRKARIAHWSLRLTGKLNERRYDGLLARDLSKLVKSKNLPLLNYIFMQTYCAILSWTQMLMLLKYELILCNGIFFKDSTFLKIGDIVELPFSTFYQNNEHNIAYIKKIIGRSKKVMYKNSKKKTFKQKQLLKTPKIFKKLPTLFKRFGSNFGYDPALQIFGLFYKLPRHFHHLDYVITYSSVLTLQNWRYRFD